MSHIISIQNLGKRYNLKKGQPYYSLRDTISGIFKKHESISKDFWALKNVDIEIDKGESIGIIGRNGAGKSTLLKILSQITPPTAGRIILNGSVASLLEIGTGFHQELTGRENIYLNGAILGMKRDEVKRKFDEIVDFSEIEKFLDTPVKHYSSGMYMRLAFAVAAHLDSEILIVDEILSVGDAQFQKKCISKMGEVSKDEGKTVMFVSHNMDSISKLCSRSVLLQEGKVSFDGASQKTIEYYLDEIDKTSKQALIDRTDRSGLGETKYTDIIFNNNKPVISGKDLEFKIKYQSKISKTLKNCRIGVTFKSTAGQFLFICATELQFPEILNLKATGAIECEIENLPLSEGNYRIDLFLEINKEIQDWIMDARQFHVNPGAFYSGSRQTPNGFEGQGVLVKHNWAIHDK